MKLFKNSQRSEYSQKFPIFPQNSQHFWWKFTTLKIPGNFASLATQLVIHKKPKECKHWMLKIIPLLVFYLDELIPLFEFDYIFQIDTLQ